MPHRLVLVKKNKQKLVCITKKDAATIPHAKTKKKTSTRYINYLGVQKVPYKNSVKNKLHIPSRLSKSTRPKIYIEQMVP